MAKIARLNLQRQIHGQLQAFINRMENRLGSGVIVLRLAPVNRIGRWPDHHAGRRIDLA